MAKRQLPIDVVPGRSDDLWFRWNAPAPSFSGHRRTSCEGNLDAAGVGVGSCVAELIREYRKLEAENEALKASIAALKKG